MDRQLRFKKGQIVWCTLDGENYEQRGTRPCIIAQNDVGNKHSTTTLVVPFTSRKTKSKLPVHVEIKKEEFKNTKLKDSIALCEQVRVIDRRRITYVEKCILSEETMEKIHKALLISFGFGEEKKDKKVVFIRLKDGVGSEHRSSNPFPALVIQNQKGNKYSPTLIVAPFGLCKRKKLPTQVYVPGDQVCRQFKDSVVMLEQIRVIDKSRVVQEIEETHLSEQIHKEIEKAILISFGIELKHAIN
ncbi:type II toxin-antitoxin system PemK/MazF family toxin [Bacillus mexicanus]|uniref:type II toxin-antitoxin system PemK/MazF family toxin n=1 Tax=Bacillus mexicanus TaxID=2834415 RepID=UPI003D193218